jgi:anthranilate phosphoribosyltransferase
MKDITYKLRSGSLLKKEEIRRAFEALLRDETSESEIAEFLAALSERPVDADLLTEAAGVLLNYAVPVHLQTSHALDTCGTGGDKSGSFNFSTAAALLAAACGVPVAKHGNRSITSKSGSADLLEALGIPIDLGPEEVAKSVAENRFAFMMAPRYHPAHQKVPKVRRQLGKVTVFNFLGPLLNPARVKFQLVGVFDNAVRPAMAEALRRLGAEKAWVVWGEGGLDEMTLGGKSYVSEVTPRGVTERVLEPEDAVLRKCDTKFLSGGDAEKNAKILEGVFQKSFFGPLVNGILFNTGAALCVAGKVENIREGVRMARSAIENGEAFALLERLRNPSP